MSNIDKRIVEMQFDNKQFEKGVKDTVSSLSDLKKGLDLSGSSKNLADLQTQGNKFSLANITTSVQSLSDRFSTFGIIGMTALQNITNSAIDLGKKITSAVMAPLLEGGKRRALNIEQAKFQFEGLGMDVEATMADASYAVDGTAYSLDAAAKVASQLGASGMRAGEDMRNSLRAVSGVAAMAGSSYEDIGNVFTKVAGQGRLMGDDLLRLSSRGINAAATIAKELNKTEAEVRDMVTKGKINFEMFSEAMDSAFGEHATAANKTFTGSLSNVKSALARIGEKFYTPFNKNLIAPLNALRVVINDINKAIDPAFVALSKFMELGSGKVVEKLQSLDFSSLTASLPILVENISGLFKGVFNVFKELQFVMKLIGKAWSDVFPSFPGEVLTELSKKISEILSRFKIGMPTLQNIYQTFKGLFSIVSIFKTLISAMLPIIGRIFKALSPMVNLLLSFTASVGRMITRLAEAAKGADTFGSVFSSLGDIFSTIAKIISNAFKIIVGAANSLTDSISFNWLETLGNILTAVGNAFKFLGGKIKEFFTAAGMSDVKSFIDIGFLLYVIDAIKRISFSLTQVFGLKSGTGIIGNITNSISNLRGALFEMQRKLKAEMIRTLAISVGILAASLFVLSKIDADALARSLTAMTVSFGELLGSMAILSKLNLKGITKVTGTVIGLSTAILILSFAMKNISSLDTAGIAKSLISITTLLGALIGFLWAIPEKKIVKGAKNIIQLSVALLIMSYAMKNIASMSWEGLAKGIIGLGVILGALIGFLWGIPKKKVVKGALNLVILSTALLLLTKVAKNLADMSWEGLAKAGAGIVGALGIIIGFLWGIPKDKVVKGSLSLVILSTALLIMTKVAQNLASMSWEGLGKAGAGLVGGLGIIIGFLWAIPKAIAKKAASFLIVSISLLAMTKALTVMGNMPWENIGKAGVVLAGSLTLIAGGLHLMNGALPGAAALLVVTAALALLTPVLLALGAMSLPTIGKSLLMLAGVFTVIGVSALFLGPIVPVIFALGGALLVLGAGVALAGVGVLALGAGLTALAAAFAASGGAIFSVVRGFLTLIPEFFKKLGEGIVAFVKAIADSSDAIFEGVAKIIVGILQAIIDAMPKFFEAVTVLLIGICDLIIDTVPKFIEVIFVVITTLLDELVEFVPKFVDASMKIMTGILTGIAENVPKVAKAGADVVIAFLRAIGTETPRIIDAGFKMIIDFINGLAGSIRENTPELIVAGQNLADALLRAIADVLTGGIFWFSKKGEESGEAYEGGMAGKIKDVKTKAGELATEALEGLKSKAKEMYDAGVDGIKGFILGLGSKAKQVWDKTKEMGTSAVIAAKTALDSSSPSKEFIYIGQAIGEGLAIGIDNSIGDPVRAISNMMSEIMNIASRDFEKFEKWMSDRKYFEEISLIEELTAWELIQNAAWRSAEEREKAEREVFRIQKALVKETYQYSVDWMDERKYYNELSLEEELAAWERVQSRYMEGSDERKKADREVYRLRNELMETSYQHSLNWIAMEKEAGRLSLEAEIAAYERIKSRYSETDEEYTAAVQAQTQARIDAKKAEFDHSMDWIEQRKYYGELTLAEELSAYTRVQQRYEKGTEERLKMDKEVYRLQKEINEARTKYYDDVAKIEEDRKNKRIQLEQEYADKTKEINQKLQDDIQRLDDNYKNALDSRTKAIYDSYGLFDKVEARKAVSGSTLMKNLQDQVDDLDKWQSQLSQLSAKGLNSALIDELQEMGPSAMAELEALNSMSSSELAQYATLWSTKHKQAKTQATSELEDLRIKTQSQIADLRVESAKELDDYRKMWNQKMSDLNTETNKQLKQLKKDFDKQIGIVKANTESDFREMTSNVKEVMQQAGWNEMGQQIVDGLSGGIDSRKQSFIDTIIGVIQGGISAVRNVADIHSPSRVFAKMGRYMDDGLVVGLKQYSNRVVDASADVGREAIDSMSNAISGIGSIVNGDMDIAPTIRPVMDMSDFRSGLSYMDTALTADRSMLLGVTAAANQNGTNSYIDELASKLSDANTQSNNKITSAIEGLKSDFTGLVDKVTKLQVVMDTGTLVGAIGPDMDRELGGLSNMTRRGVR